MSMMPDFEYYESDDTDSYYRYKGGYYDPPDIIPDLRKEVEKLEVRIASLETDTIIMRSQATALQLENHTQTLKISTLEEEKRLLKQEVEKLKEIIAAPEREMQKRAEFLIQNPDFLEIL
jgi:hypothetical protein